MLSVCHQLSLWHCLILAQARLPQLVPILRRISTALLAPANPAVMDIGDQGPETRAKLEFIDLLPASKPRGIHAARERERLAQQQEALAGLDPAKAAAPLSSGSAPGARAAQLTFPTEPVGTELAARTDTPQLTQDTSPVEGHSPWSASHPSDGRMVEDTSRWGDPLAAPFIHVTDQTQSDVGTLALLRRIRRLPELTARGSRRIQHLSLRRGGRGSCRLQPQPNPRRTCVELRTGSERWRPPTPTP